MPQIIPIKDMRNTTKISDMCHATDEPIYVTKNGYGDMVVLSIESYESLMARIRTYDQVMQGKAQADRGELIDSSEGLASLRGKYGREIHT